MKLIGTSFFTAISTFIKMISVFIINKLMAIFIGPSGLALIGQLQNFTSICTTFSNGAITSGVVKYTAEHSEIKEKQKIFSTSIIVCISCASLMALCLISFSTYLSDLILKETKFYSVFILFGFTIILFAINTLLLAILNGQKEIKKYIFVNISGSVVSLLVTSLLIIKLNLIGGLYALVINQSITCFVTIAFVIKSKWFKLSSFTKGIDKHYLIKLSKYSIMSIVSVIAGPFVLILIRNYIAKTIGWDQAGFWQAIWYISSMYLMVITTSLSVYYLPKLSEIKDNQEIKREIINGYKIILPVVSILALFIFLFKKFIVVIAFEQSFMAILPLFTWQLIGDVIKITSWLIAYLMLAKAMTKLFVITEIVFSATLFFLSIYFIDFFGLVGVTYAYALNYFIHLLTMIYFFYKKFK